MRILGLTALLTTLYLLIKDTVALAANVKKIQNATDLDDESAQKLVDSFVIQNKTMQDANESMQKVRNELLSKRRTAAPTAVPTKKPSAKGKGIGKATKPPTVSQTQPETVWNRNGDIEGKASSFGFPYGYDVKEKEIYLVGKFPPKSTPVIMFGEGANSVTIFLEPITNARTEITYKAGASIKPRKIAGKLYWPFRCNCIDGSFDTVLTTDGQYIKDADGYNLVQRSGKMFDPNNPSVMSLSLSDGDADLTIYSTQQRSVKGYVNGVYGDWPVMPSSWTLYSYGEQLAKSSGKVRVQLDPGHKVQARRDFPDELFDKRRQLASDEKIDLPLAKRFGLVRAALLDVALKNRGITVEELQSLPEDEQKEIAKKVGENLEKLSKKFGENLVDLVVFISKHGEEGLSEELKKGKLRGGS